MAWAGEVLEDRSNDIPVFWAEREGPVLGGLCFGVGQADEELWNAGITHLVEHLTLFGIGPREHGFNGRVEGRSTTFWAEGTIDEVKDFLSAVATSIADLPIDRLSSERTVLMTEAGTRSRSITNLLLHRRFGPRSWGLADLHEFGLESLGGDQVGDWASRHFVTGNAAIFLTADPKGFTVDLPAGEREPRRPVPDPIRGLELPAFDTGPPGAMAIGSTVERSTALQMSLQIAAKLASDSLRMGQGLTYSVEADYLHLDSDQAHVSLTASCLDEHAVTVRNGLLDVLEQQAADGPPREEIDAYLKGAVRFEVDPRAIPFALDARAHAHVAGEQLPSRAELRDEAEATTAEEIVAATAEVLSNAILLSPPETEPLDRNGFSLYRVDESAPVTGGKTWQQRKIGMVRRISKSTVTVAPEGISVLGLEEGDITIRADDLVALFEPPGGELIALDSLGSTVQFLPESFDNSAELRLAIRDLFEPHQRINIDDHDGDQAALLAELVKEDLLDKTMVPGAFASLPARLEPGEKPIRMVEGRHRFYGPRFGRTYLLLLTDRRLIFTSPIPDGEDDFYFYPHESLRKVRGHPGLPPLLKPKLSIKTPSRWHWLTDVWSPSGVSKFVEATRKAIDEASQSESAASPR